MQSSGIKNNINIMFLFRIIYRHLFSTMYNVIDMGGGAHRLRFFLIFEHVYVHENSNSNFEHLKLHAQREILAIELALAISRSIYIDR